MRAGCIPALGLLLGACELIAPPPPPFVEPVPGFVVSQPVPDVRALTDVAVLTTNSERITLAYAVGTDGAILRYDGAAWTQEFTGLDADLESISGVVDQGGIETVLAVGAAGAIVQRIDGRWGQLQSPATAHLFSCLSLIHI